MDENILINYYGQKLAVTKEIADYLARSDREIANSDRRYRRHNVPLVYFAPDKVMDGDLVSTVIRNANNEQVRRIIRSLGKQQQKLYYLRYECDLTQQAIAEKLGISKMAVCKRLKKLHGIVASIMQAS